MGESQIFSSTIRLRRSLIQKSNDRGRQCKHKRKPGVKIRRDIKFKCLFKRRNRIKSLPRGSEGARRGFFLFFFLCSPSFFSRYTYSEEQLKVTTGNLQREVFQLKNMQRTCALARYLKQGKNTLLDRCDRDYLAAPTGRCGTWFFLGSWDFK